MKKKIKAKRKKKSLLITIWLGAIVTRLFSSYVRVVLNQRAGLSFIPYYYTYLVSIGDSRTSERVEPANEPTTGTSWHCLC